MSIFTKYVVITYCSLKIVIHTVGAIYVLYLINYILLTRLDYSNLYGILYVKDLKNTNFTITMIVKCDIIAGQICRRIIGKKIKSSFII